MSFTLELLVFMGLTSLILVLTLVLLWRVIKLTRHYNNLTKGADSKSLMRVLEGIQKTLGEHERGNVLLKNELKQLAAAGELHLQNLTLKRFNPFGDTGGDQSFILAILDGNKDGVVITSLHSRENTRFYVKSVKGGVGIDHPLSDEETKIIKRGRS